MRKCRDEGKINIRTESLINDILAIWPVPPGHQSSARAKKEANKIRVTIQDLMSADLLQAGQVLYPSDSKSTEITAVILQDGSIGIGDNISDTPSGAGKFLRKRAINGWGFWLLNPITKESLRDVRTKYLDQLIAEGADIEGEDDY